MSFKGGLIDLQVPAHLDKHFILEVGEYATIDNCRICLEDINIYSGIVWVLGTITKGEKSAHFPMNEKHTKFQFEEYLLELTQIGYKRAGFIFIKHQPKPTF